MRAVPFQKLIDAITARAGIDPALPEDSLRGALLADYLEDALEYAWGFYEWEDVTLTESRTPATHTITLITATANPIGEVLAVYDSDPADPSSPAVELTFTTTDTTLVLDADSHTANTPVFVKFRLPAPAFTIAAYETTRAYAPGDVVLFGPDCYRAFASTTGNAPTSTAHWKKQEIPHYLGEYAKTSVLAEIALAAPGLEQRGDYLSRRAEGQLMSEMDKQWFRRGRHHHYTAKFTH